MSVTEIWRDDVSCSPTPPDGTVNIDGPAQVRRSVPGWLGQFTSAAVPRPA